MGANAKRKAARALRFGNVEKSSSATAPAETDGAIDSKSTDRPPAEGNDAEKWDGSEDSFEPLSSDQEEQGQEQKPKSGRTSTRTGKAAPQRFICFIGNLPFSATEAALRQRFASVKPTAVRLRTDKTTGRCRGFAFMEFDTKDNLQACLRRFHHAHFPEGPVSGEGKGGSTDAVEGADGEPVKEAKPGRSWRRINVELTYVLLSCAPVMLLIFNVLSELDLTARSVGGGGHHSKGRKVRLQAKNDRLNKQRRRRAAALAEKHGGEKTVNERSTGEATETEEAASTNDAGNIHPSRMSRVGA